MWHVWQDADQIYPSWKEKLGYTGESSVQAASFDWGKKVAAAGATGFVGCPPFYFERPRATYVGLEYGNGFGYFPDGTAYNLAGNEVNRPENIKADPHTPGADLPKTVFVNDAVYFPNGTAYNLAGNEINHPLVQVLGKSFKMMP